MLDQTQLKNHNNFTSSKENILLDGSVIEISGKNTKRGAVAFNRTTLNLNLNSLLFLYFLFIY